MQAIKLWYSDLARKEQQLILLLGLVLVVFIFVKLVWQPIADSRDRLLVKNEQAQDELRAVRALAAEYKALKKMGAKSVGGSSGNLNQLLNSSVKRHQLSLKRLQPSSSGDVQLRFENAVFNQLVAWLNELEVASGVVVKDISITPASSAGLVNVSIRVRNG